MIHLVFDASRCLPNANIEDFLQTTDSKDKEKLIKVAAK